MKKSVVIVLTTLLGVTLVGCSSEPGNYRISPDQEETLIGEWVATDRGDVYCLINKSYRDNKITDCDWDSLVEVGTHTTNADEVREGAWLPTEYGEVYCLLNRTYMDYKATDCDWSTAN